MSKQIRQLQGQNTEDPSTIENLTFSIPGGSRKVTEVGRHLLPLSTVALGVQSWSTNATTTTILDAPGKLLAVYNNSATLASVTLGSATPVTSLAAGAVSADGSSVGYPCIPNAWTYIACDDQRYVIASAATLFVFLVDDGTVLKTENP
jgi:hypothetical protein